MSEGPRRQIETARPMLRSVGDALGERHGNLHLELLSRTTPLSANLNANGRTESRSRGATTPIRPRVPDASRPTRARCDVGATVCRYFRSLTSVYSASTTFSSCLPPPALSSPPVPVPAPVAWVLAWASAYIASPSFCA